MCYITYGKRRIELFEMRLTESFCKSRPIKMASWREYMCGIEANVDFMIFTISWFRLWASKDLRSVVSSCIMQPSDHTSLLLVYG